MTITTDYTELRDKQQKVWSSGDYNKIAALTVPVSEHLVDHVGVEPGDARPRRRDRHRPRRPGRRPPLGRGPSASTTCPSCSRSPAAAPRPRTWTIDFAEADAEDLPYGDASFDVVLSAIGVMFAADHARAARELVRVARPGGRIGVASWTPEGFVGGMLATVGRHVAPPAGAQPATRWGVEAVVAELLGDEVTDVAVRHRHRAPALRRRGGRSPTCSSPTTARRTRRPAGWTTRAAPRSAPTWSRSRAPSTGAPATAWSSTGSTASSRRPAADAHHHHQHAMTRNPNHEHQVEHRVQPLPPASLLAGRGPHRGQHGDRWCRRSSSPARTSRTSPSPAVTSATAASRAPTSETAR